MSRPIKTPGGAPVSPKTCAAVLPTGRWRGFWIQGTVRSRTELDLIFRDGQIRGDGSDWVGDFVIRGAYDVLTGKIGWTKSYRGQHEIVYSGFIEPGNGIWGCWEIVEFDRGGFHLWPDAQAIDAAHAEMSRSAGGRSGGVSTLPTVGLGGPGGGENGAVAN